MQKDLMSCYAGFGDTLYKTGDFTGAYANHSAALKIFDEVFGAGGRRLLRAKYYALLAGDLAAIGNKSEALKKYEKSLKILDEILKQSTDDERAKALKYEIEAKIKGLYINLRFSNRFCHANLPSLAI